MVFARALLVLLILAAPPAWAADGPKPGGPLASEMIAGRLSEKPIDLHGAMVTEIHIADMRLVLERTKLGEVQARFGGDLHRSGEAGSAADWICYRTAATRSGPPMLIWLVSDSEMSDDHEITDVALELAEGTKSPACSDLRGDVGIDIGLPMLGVDKRTLAQLFGSADADSAGYVSYVYTSDMKQDSGMGQSLTYKFEGAAVALEVGQETTD